MLPVFTVAMPKFKTDLNAVIGWPHWSPKERKQWLPSWYPLSSFSFQFINWWIYWYLERTLELDTDCYKSKGNLPGGQSCLLEGCYLKEMQHRSEHLKPSKVAHHPRPLVVPQEEERIKEIMKRNLDNEQRTQHAVLGSSVWNELLIREGSIRNWLGDCFLLLSLQKETL